MKKISKHQSFNLKLITKHSKLLKTAYPFFIKEAKAPGSHENLEGLPPS